MVPKCASLAPLHLDTCSQVRAQSFPSDVDKFKSTHGAWESRLRRRKGGAGLGDTQISSDPLPESLGLSAAWWGKGEGRRQNG